MAVKSKQAEAKGLVPRLRFRQPANPAGWSNRPLSNSLSPRAAKDDGHCEVYSVSVSRGLVNQMEYLGRRFAASDTSRYTIVMPFDVVYTKSPTGEFPYGIVKQSTVPHPVIVSPLYDVFEPSNKYIGTLVHNYFESSARASIYLQPLVKKGAKNTIQISAETFLSGSIPFPESVLEQQKIADCLSSLDDRIAAETRQLDALKTHKRGLLQQLFPRENETVPRLRFSAYAGADNWVLAKLGNVANIQSGGTPLRTNESYWGGDIPWVTTSLIDGGLITSTVEYITASGLAESSAKVFPKGTVLMAMYGQGKTRGKVAMLGIEATTNQACAAIQLHAQVGERFVFQNLAARYDELRSISNDGGQKNLSLGLIAALPLVYPRDVGEQRKIADCLTSLDDLIAAQAKKIDLLKQHKRGLMQQLFPSIGGVDGAAGRGGHPVLDGAA